MTKLWNGEPAERYEPAPDEFPSDLVLAIVVAVGLLGLAFAIRLGVHIVLAAVGFIVFYAVCGYFLARRKR